MYKLNSLFFRDQTKLLKGVIEVNPKDIFDDGIIKELIKLIARFLDKSLIFKMVSYFISINILNKNLIYLGNSRWFLKEIINACWKSSKYFIFLFV